MARRIGFIIGSIALFGVTNRLVERVREWNEHTSSPGAYGVFLEMLLVVSALLMILGTTLLALRFRNTLRWIIALVAGLSISSAVVLDLGGRTELWVVALLYFSPQLLLVLTGKALVGKQAGESHASHGVDV